MAMNPYLALQFAQGIPKDTISQGTGKLVETVRGIQAAKARRQQEMQYQQALQGYMQDQSPENLQNVYSAAEPLGRFEMIQSSLSDMTAAQRQEEVRKLGSIMAPLYSGMPDQALSNIDSLVEAYKNEGDLGEVKKLNQLRQSIADGDVDKVQAYLGILLGGSEEGRSFIDNLSTFGGERRAEMATEMDMLKIANQLEWATPEDRSRALELADGYDLDTAEKMIELSNGFSTLAGMSSKDIVDAYLPIEKEYNDLVQPYEETMVNAQAIRDSSFLETGAASQTMVSLFNKVLDPESVVRQSEVDATLDAAGVKTQIVTLLDRLNGGAFLDAPARKALVDAVNVIENNSRGRMIGIQEDIGALIDEAGLKRDVIFSSEGTPEEIELNRARMLIRASFPEDSFDIENSSLESLQKEYPNTLNRIMQRGGGATIQSTSNPQTPTGVGVPPPPAPAAEESEDEWVL